MLATAPFLAGVGALCALDVAGHPPYADQAVRQRLLDFMEDGAPAC